MEHDIKIGEQILHYDETGSPDSDPVILMHGWGCDHTTVRSIAAALEKTMHVFNIDLPGHGKSPEPASVWGVEDYTRCIEKFAQTLGLRTPALVGHSFGGRIGLLMASRNNISKMMLVDAAGIKPNRKPSYYLKVYSFKIAKHLLPKIFGEKQGSKMIEAWRGKAGSADYKQSSPKMRAIMSKCVNEDLKHVMPLIKAPTLLVWGALDTATPLKDAKYMEKHIPDAGLVSFKEAGHYSFLDNPAQFKAVTQSFFKKS